MTDLMLFNDNFSGLFILFLTCQPFNIQTNQLNRI